MWYPRKRVPMPASVAKDPKRILLNCSPFMVNKPGSSLLGGRSVDIEYLRFI